MASKRWQFDRTLPASVNLWGVRVRVRVLRGEDRERLNGCDSAWLYNYEDDVALILVDGELPLPVQRYCLLHELQHATIEMLDIAIEKFGDVVQTKRMAGLAADPRTQTLPRVDPLGG